MFLTIKKYDTEITSVSNISKKFGKYQILQYIYASLPAVFVSMINVNYIFGAGHVGYRCRIRECDSIITNYSVPWWPNHTDQCTKPILNQTYLDDGVCTNNSFTGAMEQCTDWVYENHNTIISKIGTVNKLDGGVVTICSISILRPQERSDCSCVGVEPGWIFKDVIRHKKNLNVLDVYQLNLACQPWQRNMVGTIHNIGMTIAQLSAGWIADIYGRKITLVICAIGCVIGNFKTLASTYSLYVSLEFLEALLSGGIYTVGAVLMLELAGNNNRMLAGVLFSCAIYLGEAAFAIIGIVVPYWKTVIYIICTPPLLFTFYFILLNESFRWLILKGKTSKARETLKKMVEMNKINTDMEEINSIDREKLKAMFNLDKTETKEGMKQVYKCRPLFTWFLITSFSRFTVSFAYYGLLINSVELPGDKHTKFLLAACMSFPGEIVSLYFMNKTGRRLPLIFGFLLIGVSCIASGYVPHNYVWLKIFLFLLSKLVTSTCFTGIGTYSMELFPTSVRGTLLGLCTVASSIGNMLAPLSPLLTPFMASILFGCLAIISSALLYFTPETKDSFLMDTIEQVTDSIKDNKNKKNAKEMKI